MSSVVRKYLNIPVFWMLMVQPQAVVLLVGRGLIIGRVLCPTDFRSVLLELLKVCVLNSPHFRGAGLPYLLHTSGILRPNRLLFLELPCFCLWPTALEHSEEVYRPMKTLGWKWRLFLRRKICPVYGGIEYPEEAQMHVWWR